MPTGTNQSPLGPLSVPEARLVEIARQLIPAITSDTETNRRKIAATWLSDLHTVLEKWNAELIDLVRTYPGFKGRTDLASYKRFFRKLDTKNTRELYHDRSVVKRLCRPIEKLYNQFPIDFNWLQERSPNTYNDVYGLIQNAYDGEGRIILMAHDLINAIYGLDIEILRKRYDTVIKEIDDYHGDKRIEEFYDKFLPEHIKYRETICQRINEYEQRSAQTVYDLQQISEEADLQLIPLEHSDVRKNIGYTDPKAVIQLSGTPQNEHKILYVMLAFSSGVIFLLSVLAIAILIPKPEPFQIRVFTTVMAIAAAGVATVMTGLIDAQIKLGTQLLIGATGGLAVFVIVYMVNPAVLG